MGRTKKVVATEFTDTNGNVTTVAEPKLNDMAVGMVFYEGKYHAIQIPFDYLTGLTGDIEVIESNTDRDCILTRFEVISGKIMGWNV